MDEQIQLFGRADLHMHTTASDGWADVEDVLNRVAETGKLNVIAITDHDVIDASLWAYERRHNYAFDIVPGLEVSSAEGHVLALWVTQTVPAGMSLTETTAAIHELGGLAVLAHPYEILVSARAAWRYLRNPQVLIEAGIDALEVHNSGTPTPGNNWLARRTAEKWGLTVVGNSDAHTLNAIGCGITRFRGQTAADLRQALVNGETLAEGMPWPITDYLRLLPSSTQSKLNNFLGMSGRLIHLIRT